jgi:putative transposase
MGRSSTPSSPAVKLDFNQKQKILGMLGLDVNEIVREGVETVIASGTRVLLEALMQAEVEQRCGEKHTRGAARECVRWGSERGTAKIGGGTTTVHRPRIRMLRTVGEAQLETYKAMNTAELIDRHLFATVLAGVSTRRYASIVSQGLEMKGVSRSSVSRKMIVATKPLVDEFLKRRIDAVEPVVLIFDGIHVAKRQLIACIGIDNDGRKQVLALKTGATENEIVCRDLIRDLIERGLKSDALYLFVIDGSKALVAAIHAAFGPDVAIQRCQEHKIRDVQAYVPVGMRVQIRNKMQAAYGEKTEKNALARLCQLRSELGLVSEAAVTSLTEGMLQTVTVHRLAVKGLLRDSLRTTNIIESAFSSVRRYMGRVTRFRTEADRERWVIRSLIETERHFRTIKGCRQLTKLRKKLETYDAKTPIN